MSGHTLSGIALLLSLSPLKANASPQSHQPARQQASIDIFVRSPVRLTTRESRKLQGDIRAHGRNNAEEIVRRLYQDKGYFKVEVRTIRTPTVRTKTLVVEVNPGKQYHLLRISWRGNAAFSQSELDKLISVEPGELFSRTKIAEGLNAARKLYLSRGYINFTAIPTPVPDDDAGTVAFEMEIDEGGQFRFGELDVQGMEEAHREILLSAWQGLRGRPYNAKDADEFFKRYFRSPQPNIKPEDYTVRRIDEGNRLVSYSIRFVPSVRYRLSRSSQPVEITNP